MTDQQPCHLYKVKVGETTLGPTVCGAESEKTGSELCPECVIKGRPMPDFAATYKRTTDSTLNHMMALMEWMTECRLADLMDVPETILTKYFEQSPLWSRVPPPEETDD